LKHFVEKLARLLSNRQIDPGKVFDLELPPEQAAARYQAMDQRRAIRSSSGRDQKRN
jgi:threonine dehydrogenase-like Zn-dependent dehydrogenase